MSSLLSSFTPARARDAHARALASAVSAWTVAHLADQVVERRAATAISIRALRGSAATWTVVRAG